jgi:hypothetical protein
MKTNLTAEILLNSFVIAVVAALVRVLFTVVKSFADTFFTFLGGILFGVLAGYLANDIVWLENWIKILIAAFSLMGKEIFTALKQAATDPIGSFKKFRSSGVTNITNTIVKKEDDTN